MIAVIIVPGPKPEMLGLDEHAPTSLLPLVDRPVIQHLIEFLLLEGARSFELFIERQAKLVEAYLGNGARWGCSIRYHPVAHSSRPYLSLAALPHLRREPWFLVQAGHFPYVSLSSYGNEAHPVFFCVEANPTSKHPISPKWTGAACLPAGFDPAGLAPLSQPQLAACWLRQEQAGHARSVPVPACVNTENPAALLDAQRQLLDRCFDRLLINGIEKQPGIWLSRKAALHASVQMTPPVYVGANARIERGASLGPYAVIGPNSIIDAHTAVRNSLVTAGTYVGQSLELDAVIADRRLLVHSKLETAVLLKENFLLGELS